MKPPCTNHDFNDKENETLPAFDILVLCPVQRKTCIFLVNAYKIFLAWVWRIYLASMHDSCYFISNYLQQRGFTAACYRLDGSVVWD